MISCYSSVGHERSPPKRQVPGSSPGSNASRAAFQKSESGFLFFPPSPVKKRPMETATKRLQLLRKAEMSGEKQRYQRTEAKCERKRKFEMPTYKAQWKTWRTSARFCVADDKSGVRMAETVCRWLRRRLLLCACLIGASEASPLASKQVRRGTNGSTKPFFCFVRSLKNGNSLLLRFIFGIDAMYICQNFLCKYLLLL